MTTPANDHDTPSEPRLTSLAHGGGCGCKLAPDVLAEILDGVSLPIGRPEFLVDASSSDDAAVYQLTDDLALVATTDFFTPIVDDPYEFGRIAATNALSDIYAMGARPIFCLAVTGMPVDKLKVETIQDILDGGREVADSAGAPIAGGHSIDAAEPIYGLVALGLVHPKQVKTNGGAKPGDKLILGKPLGVGIFSAALKREILDEGGYEEMIASTTRLNTPGASLGAMEGVRAMTDVTGFGLFGHLSEMLRASSRAGSNVGAVINADAVPIFDRARALALQGVRTGASARNWRAISHLVEDGAALPDAMRDIFTDPQTSGGLLVACTPESEALVLKAFHDDGHADAAVIGEIIAAAQPSIIVQ